MKEDSNFNILNGQHWKLMIELSRFLVMEHQQKLVNQEENDVEHQCKWI